MVVLNLTVENGLHTWEAGDVTYTWHAGALIIQKITQAQVSIIHIERQGHLYDPSLKEAEAAIKKDMEREINMFDATREKDLAGKFAFYQTRVECETHEEAVKAVAGGNRVVVAGPERYDLVTEGFDNSRVYWMYEANANVAASQVVEG